MSELFSDDRIKNIIENFPIREESVRLIVTDYEKLIQDVPYQYLAHIMRTMENYIRKNIERAEFFRITCMPTEESNDELKDLAGATYQEKYSFDIVYDRNMSELRKKVCIAHELGHLWLLIHADREYGDKHEPLSSVYGFLIMLHKFDCKNQIVSRIKRNTYDDEKKLMQEFLFVMNRNTGKYNTSQVFK